MKYLAVFFLFVSSTSFADVKPWGLGVILAHPTGFSGKHRMSHSRSIDAAVGYNTGGNDYLAIHSTYLWEHPKDLLIGKAALGYFFGVGGALYSRDEGPDRPSWANDRDDTLGLAIRGSGGLNYYFEKAPVEVFAQISLDFFFIPGTEADLDLAIGGRYYF